MDPKTEKTWKSLVYNVSITPSAVKEFYEGWAVLYDEDQVKLKTGADHLADELINTLKCLGKEDFQVIFTLIKIILQNRLSCQSWMLPAELVL